MNAWLLRLFGKRRQLLSDEQINALAKDADRFENEFGTENLVAGAPQVYDGDDE